MGGVGARREPTVTHSVPHIFLPSALATLRRRHDGVAQWQCALQHDGAGPPARVVLRLARYWGAVSYDATRNSDSDSVRVTVSP